jgi:hypothetical protein
MQGTTVLFICQEGNKVFFSDVLIDWFSGGKTKSQKTSLAWFVLFSEFLV